MKEIRLSEERLRLLADNADDVIWTMGADGRLSYVSPSVERLRGYTAAETLQQRLEEILPAASRQVVINHLLASFARHQQGLPVENFRQELEVLCKGGGTVWTSTTVSNIFDAQGRFVEMLGVTRDISERKRFEGELLRASQESARANETLLAIIECMSDWVWEVDAAGRYTYCSPQVESCLGFAPAELLGKTPFELMPRGMAGEIEARLQEICRAGERFRDVEYWVVAGDGRQLLISTSGVPVLDSAGTVSGYRGIGRDITRLRHDQQRLEHLAHFDPLTSLPNRTLFSHHLSQGLALARRHRVHLALIYLDLDHFKPVNDSYGHAVGDLLLQEAAARMAGAVRESDLVGRIGGDEFAVLLQDLETEEDALLAAGKIRQALQQPLTVDAMRLTVTASIGVALYPQHGRDSIELSRHAEQAMYIAKEEGRNRVRLFAPQSAGEAAAC